MRELHATTPAGQDLVWRAERHAARFVDSAAVHDREATYAHEHVAELRDTGFLYAPIPEEHGGLGVSSVHDVLVACSRLARGDAATTLGVNMQLAVTQNLLRRARVLERRGEAARAEELRAVLGLVAATGTVVSSAVSEPDQDLGRPSTVAVRDGDEWVITGRKWFCTMVPAATLLAVAVRYDDGDGVERYGFAMVPKATPGIEVHDDWHALGMRASGSNSVSFHDVRVPASAVTDGVPVGRSEVAMFDRYLSSGAFHAAASLGVAEAAHELAVVGATKRRGAHPDEGWVRSQVAASTFDLYAMRSAFDRAAHLCDEVDALDLRGEASAAEWAGWFAEVQSAKAIVCDGAVRVVDRALALSGGAGFFASHPLAKAYRDVRACGFMHPLGANRASGFVADVSLGDVPVLR